MKPKSISRVINEPINTSRAAYLNSCIRFIIVIALIVYTIKANAQTGREVVSQSIQWTAVNSNIKLNNRLGVALDGQFRFAEYNTMQNQLRAGLEIFVTKKMAVIPVHYSYIWNSLYGKQPATYANNEHRIGQQITYKHSYGRLNFNHRLRFEERFIQVHSKNANNEIVDEGYTNKQFRMRYRALVNIPLNHAKMDAKTLYLCIWGEAFMSRGKAVTYQDVDQSRVFAGPGYQFTKNVSVQGGFLYQSLIKANGAKQEKNMGALLQFTYNLDLTKKTESFR